MAVPLPRALSAAGYEQIFIGETVCFINRDLDDAARLVQYRLHFFQEFGRVFGLSDDRSDDRMEAIWRMVSGTDEDRSAETKDDAPGCHDRLAAAETKDDAPQFRGPAEAESRRCRDRLARAEAEAAESRKFNRATETEMAAVLDRLRKADDRVRELAAQVAELVRAANDARDAADTALSKQARAVGVLKTKNKELKRNQRKLTCRLRRMSEELKEATAKLDFHQTPDELAADLKTLRDQITGKDEQIRKDATRIERLRAQNRRMVDTFAKVCGDAKAKMKTMRRNAEFHTRCLRQRAERNMFRLLHEACILDFDAGAPSVASVQQLFIDALHKIGDWDASDVPTIRDTMRALLSKGGYPEPTDAKAEVVCTTNVGKGGLFDF